jgi:hypothetical protein
LVDIFQFLIDNRWNLSPALVNSVVLESGKAWVSVQTDRFKAWLEAHSEPAREVRIAGVQRVWKHFLGTLPTRKDLGGGRFSGHLKATRTWVIGLAGRPGSFVICESYDIDVAEP